MNFLFPSFLFGLFLVTIPIVIHLFNFQRPKLILFTNVKFLKNVKETTTSRLKLKHLLVLFSRILFIVFLVLAFAQPFIPGEESDKMYSEPNIIAYFDNSMSMQAGNDGENLLDMATRNMLKLSDKLSPNTNYQIITNDFEGKDQFLLNKDKLVERATNIKFTYTYKDFNSILKRVKNSNNSNAKNNQYFFFSDFQKSTIGDLEKLTLDSTQQYFFIPLQASQNTNIYVDSLFLSKPIVRLNEANDVVVTLKSKNLTESKKIVVKLYIDNIQVNAKEVELTPEVEQTLKLNFVCNTLGQKQCRISFDDYPIVFDNNYFFVINVSPQIKILNLYQNKSSYINKVYANTTLFEIKSSTISNIDYSLLESSSLVVLEGLDNIPEPLSLALQAFLKKGGAVAIFPAQIMDKGSYQSFFNQLSLPSFTELKIDTSIMNKNNYTLSVPDFNHPFFENIFEKADKKMDMPYLSPNIDLQGKGNSLLQFKNGSQALAQFDFLKGKIYLFAGSIAASSSSFPKHALFVPVMYKIAFESLNNTSKISYSIREDYVELVLPENIQSDKELFTLNKEEFSIIPNQQINGNNLVFSIPNIEVRPGIYRLELKNKLISYIALNQDKKESMNEMYPIAELENIFKNKKNVRIYKGDVNNSFLNSFQEDFVGISLWKYCILFAIIFLLIEILLLRFYK